MSFNFDRMDPSGKIKISMPVNIGTHLLSSTMRQTSQLDLLPRFHSPIPISMLPPQLPSSSGHSSQGMFQPSLMANNPEQLAFSSQQSTPMTLLSNLPSPANVYMDFERAFPLVKESSLSAQNSLPILNSNKRSLQREAPTKFHHTMLTNQGPHLLPLTNKRPSQPQPQPKAQQESFDSVRLKLRESLVASLTVGADQPNKHEVVDKSSPKGPVSSVVGKDEAGKESVELVSQNSDVPSDAGTVGKTSDQVEVLKTDVAQSEPSSLKNEESFSSTSIINDELLQGHGLCWVSDVNCESSDTVMNQATKKPKLLHEEVTEKLEKPEILEEMTDDSMAKAQQNAESSAVEMTDDSMAKAQQNAESSAVEMTDDSKAKAQQKAESLAVKIEAELFKLFGGVNKKYKERARSLMFNLKDRSNPELRERVLSGDIAPERLCSMTTEELASKELSEWRLAKAEELAQMVVLQDTGVDMRRLVKKTHKGEFQVEVEQDDGVSVEVAVGERISARLPVKTNGAQSKTKPDKNETKASEELVLHGNTDTGDQNESNLDSLLNEKTDLMQDLMVEDLKDTEFLPPIVSLDEFMQALDSEPPFDNLSMSPESDSLEAKSSDPAPGDLPSEVDPSPSKVDPSVEISESKFSPPQTDSKDNEDVVKDDARKEDIVTAEPDSDLKPCSAHVEPDSSLPNIRSRSENIWEGLLQLNISSLATVMGYFRSGEKTSTQEWPNYLEIKGRVRLDAFEKFLQELRVSRSRAIMIAQFSWKEKTPESGRLSICETVNSYIADQRVGFAEPAPGVEIYLCPPHPKTTEMLERHLPKDHTESLHSTTNGLIGVVVWRRPHVNTISPRLSSHHKHDTGMKKHSRRHHHQNAVNPNSTTPSFSQQKPKPPVDDDDDDDDDDVPPGFGPGKHEDDLPEFDFVHGAGANNPRSHSLAHPPARPVDQMRELILKYGKGEGAKNGASVVRKSWKDDDDIPEWQPNQTIQPVQLPPPPPQPQQPQPQPQHHNFQQQAVQQQYLVNPNLAANLVQPHQQMQYIQGPPQQLIPMVGPVSMPLQQSFHPQMAVVQGQWQQGVPYYPSDQGLPAAGMPMNLTMNGAMQPSQFGGMPGGDGQFYGVQNGMGGWRPDMTRNRGV